MIVRYSLSPGRPPGALKKLGYKVMWAAWWRSDPSTQPRPDAWGGARSNDEATEIVRAHALRFAPAVELEKLKSVFCREARSVVRWQLPANRGGPDRPQATHEPQASFRDFSSRPFDPWARAAEGTKASLDPSLRALGLKADATEADVQRAFRARAKRAHPDCGGSEPAFKALNGYYQQALRVVGARG